MCDSRSIGDAAAIDPDPARHIADGHSLRRNLFYALFGNGVLYLGNFLVVVLIAKIAGPELQGAFIFASTAIAAPIVLFCGLELRAAFVTDARGEFSFGVYRVLRYLGMAVALVVTAAVIGWVSRNEPSQAVFVLMFAVACGRIALFLADVDWGVYQRLERLDRLAWSNGLRGLVILLPFAIILPLARNSAQITWWTAAATGCYVLGWLVIWWWVDRRPVRRETSIDASWNWPAVGRLVWQTLPLGLVTLLLHLCDSVPQWVIKGATDDWNALGFFGALRIVSLGATLIIVQLGTAAGNRLATYFQYDLPAFRRLAVKLTAAAAGLGAGLLILTWAVGRWFLHVVYTAEYAEHAPEFMILMAGQAVVLLASIFGFVTTHMRQFWIQVPVQLVALTVTTIAALLLIHPEDPVRGGAWTTLVRAVTVTVLYFGCVVYGVRRRRAQEKTRPNAG